MGSDHGNYLYYWLKSYEKMSFSSLEAPFSTSKGVSNKTVRSRVDWASFHSSQPADNVINGLNPKEFPPILSIDEDRGCCRIVYLKTRSCDPIRRTNQEVKRLTTHIEWVATENNVIFNILFLGDL